MPQVLKEDIREKIIAAATEEFLNKGFKNASMREIANQANMTVGNVYRYFKNKQELMNCVITPALLRLNVILKQHSANQITFDKQINKIGLDTEHIIGLLDSIAEELVALRKEHRKELTILLKFGKQNNFIKLWVDSVIQTLIKEQVVLDLNDRTSDELLASSLSEALFAGVQDCLNAEASEDKILLNMKIFFRLFLNMFKSKQELEGVK